jgi:hypothetical protein
MKKLLLLLLVMTILGAATPALASQNHSSTPARLDWRFAGPRVRPSTPADSIWHLLFFVLDASGLNPAWQWTLP